MKAIAYLRISTSQQDAGSQKLAILKYAQEHDFKIDNFIEVQASSRQSTTKRRRKSLNRENHRRFQANTFKLSKNKSPGR